MSRVLTALLVWSLLIGIANCQKENSQARWQPEDGVYVALEKMPNISPDDSSAKWFHENTLLVRHNEAILDMVPIWIKGSKKYYSASDGGFRTYRARFFQRDGQPFISLHLFQSDYVMLPAGKDPYNEITTRSVKFESGEIYIDDVRYQRNAKDHKKRTELLRLLDTEPLEKPATR